MDDIRVRPVGDGPDMRFVVKVTGRRSTTVHRVTLSQDDFDRLGSRFASAADLVRASFEFLLERESHEDILRAFELPVIARYFPEYDEEFSRPR